MDGQEENTRYPYPAEYREWIKNHACFPLNWKPPERPARPVRKTDTKEAK